MVLNNVASHLNDQKYREEFASMQIVEITGV